MKPAPFLQTGPVLHDIVTQFHALGMEPGDFTFTSVYYR